jgi:glycosyltransferase involved in cell wall biosynthesis
MEEGASGDSLNDMSASPRLSVVIPVWNAASYLQTCLKTVLTQTLADIEVLCVDDGSTDGSLALLKGAATDKRVHVLAQRHSGAGVARNRALNVARGEYVAFMDADDTYPFADTLEQMVEAALSKRLAACGGRFWIDRDGSRTIGVLNTGPFQVAPFADTVLSYNDYQVDYGFQCFIYSRRVLMNDGIRFPPYRRFQDPPFFARAMYASGSFMGMTIPTYCHRRGHRSIVWSDTTTADMICGIRDNLEFSRKHDLARLHALSAWRLQHEYADVIRAACDRGGADVQRVLEETESKIDRGLMIRASAE